MGLTEGDAVKLQKMARQHEEDFAELRECGSLGAGSRESAFGSALVVFVCRVRQVYVVRLSWQCCIQRLRNRCLTSYYLRLGVSPRFRQASTSREWIGSSCWFDPCCVATRERMGSHQLYLCCSCAAAIANQGGLRMQPFRLARLLTTFAWQLFVRSGLLYCFLATHDAGSSPSLCNFSFTFSSVSRVRASASVALTSLSLSLSLPFSVSPSLGKMSTLAFNHQGA